MDTIEDRMIAGFKAGFYLTPMSLPPTLFIHVRVPFLKQDERLKANDWFVGFKAGGLELGAALCASVRDRKHANDNRSLSSIG